ncbi:hypothetical protein E4U23_000181 [Claviceps purpurea]|nr:hypothetical protein E4U23_000181 [Claviceps purpurea]
MASLEIDLEKGNASGNSDEKYLLQRSSPSCSRPLWTKASAMDGCVDTREAMISLHIRDDDLSTIEYHISYPSSDGHEWRRWQFQAIQALKSTPDWMTATEKLSLQEHGLVKGRDIW